MVECECFCDEIVFVCCDVIIEINVLQLGCIIVIG